jgi:hypothetical protein
MSSNDNLNNLDYYEHELLRATKDVVLFAVSNSTPIIHVPYITMTIIHNVQKKIAAARMYFALGQPQSALESSSSDRKRGG